jgi:hypothetical protein
MKIVIAQFYTQNVSYGKYAEAINRKYCEEKGYEYFCEKDTVKIKAALGDRAATWYKPTLVAEVLSNYNPDYVLFLDIDAIVSDSNQKIENFIDENYDLILTQDVGHHSVANAGVFILKNTEWSKNFLKTWNDSAEKYAGKDARDLIITEQNLEREGYFKNALWHDQTCFTILYENNEDIRNHVKIIANRYLNYPEYNKGNFIFHAFAYGLVRDRTLDVIYREKVYTESDKENINLVVYHIYCVGNYLEVVKQQLERLKTSGLYDWCDKLEITCINTKGNFEDIEDLVKDLTKVNLNKFTDNTFEYQGIKKVWEYSQQYKGKVLYFHTKGVANTYKDAQTKEESEWKKEGVRLWKEAMEYFLIDKYEDCVNKLNEYDQCGLTIHSNWWWGNFWWSNLSWVSSNLEPSPSDRWYFEGWLNSHREPFCYEYFHLDWSPYYSIMPEDFYKNKSKYSNSTIEVIEAFYGTLGEQMNESYLKTDRVMVDVTEQVRANLAANKNKGFNIRADNSIAGDPNFGFVKVLEIHFLLDGEKCVLLALENTNLIFKLQ